MVEIPLEVTREFGTNVYVVPGSAIYTLNNACDINGCHVEIGEPFQYEVFSDTKVAVDALRQIILKQKMDLYKKYSPNMTQEKFLRMRELQAIKFPYDYDYHNGEKYTLNYKLEDQATR